MEEHVENLNNNINNNPKKHLGKNILDNFTNLVNSQNNVRTKSSVNLLRYLVENKNDEREHEESYAFARLIRGLGSSTSYARAGFYSTLVGLINLSKSVTVESVFSHISKHLTKAGSNSKGENADIATGQVLVCGAIIRSRLWINSSNEDKTKVTELLLKASKERTYLVLIAYTFLIEGLKQLPKQEFQELFPLVKNEMSESKSHHNLDTLYLLYCLITTCRNNLPKKFLLNTIGSKEIVCTANLEYICNILMDIPRLTSLKHPVYEIVSKDIASSELLSQILCILDEKLEYTNRNKLLIMVKMLSIILPNIASPHVIPDLLTINFIQETLNYFKTLKRKNQDLEFYQKCQNLFNTLSEVLGRKDVASETKIQVLKKLLFFPGTFVFEKITKSKLIQHIALDLDADGVKQLATVFTGVIKGTEKIDSQYDIWLNNDRLYAAHLLLKLLNHKSIRDDNEWKIQQLCFIMDLGLFKGEAVVVGAELSASLKTAFFNALDLKLTKIQDLQIILIHLVRHIDSKISEDTLDTILRNPITPENYTIWQKTVLKITKIEQKNKKLSTLKTVFLTLFLHMALQLFNESKLATESLNDLFLCFKNTKKMRKNSCTSNESEINEDGNELSWIEVITDLFLNWMSHNSHLLRNIVKSVFPYLCEFMTASTIHQILSILDPKNKDNVLSRTSEGTSDEDDSNDEDDKDDFKSDDEDDNYSGSEEEDEPVNDKLRMALHKVLTNGTDDADVESIDLDQMSDTEAEKLDLELGNVFKQFKPNLGNSKKQSRDERTLTHFRLRALDLIEIYLNNKPAMVLALEIMLPLLQAVEYSIRDVHQKPLLDRLKSCLNKLSKVKFTNTDDINAIDLVELLKSLLDKGTKTAWIAQDMAVQIVDCCIFTIKCAEMLMKSAETSNKVQKQLNHSITKILNNELKVFFYQRDCQTQLILFKHLMKMNLDGTTNMIPNLLEFVLADNIKTHKKNQAADLLHLFYSNQRNLSQNPQQINKILSAVHQEFSTNLLELFKRLNDKSTQENLKGTFISKLLKLLNSMKNSCLKIEEIDWLEIAKNVKEYRNHVTFSNDAKESFKKLCKHVGLSSIIENKVPVNKKLDVANDKDSEETNEIKVTKINNVKKDKSERNKKLKLKKEAKMLRLQSLSTGLGKNNFKSENIDITEQDITIEDKSESTKINIENTNESRFNRKKKRKNKESDQQSNERKKKKIKS